MFQNFTDEVDNGWANILRQQRNGNSNHPVARRYAAFKNMLQNFGPQQEQQQPQQGQDVDRMYPNQTPYRDPQQFGQIMQDSFYQPQRPNGMTRGSQQGDLISMLRQRESGGNYQAKNSLGYSGAYQFGPAALEQVGLLKPGASKGGMAALEDPENWTIPGGYQAFMENPEIQDNAMRNLMQNNYKQLAREGIIDESTPKEKVNGYLAAAHLSGVGGVKKMLRGTNRKDAYGTSARDYFNLGSRAY